ncbi:MAG: DUF4293 domain-containing protein [Rikenellaceae bacterium]|nr:DUF4293 domain-containing protein [Rikenellaceae bacterium]
MIQRIQTLYLLGVVVLATLMMCLPLAEFLCGAETFNLYGYGLRSVATGEMYKTTVFLAIMLVASALLPLVNIFLYKRRMTQIRYCIVEFVLLTGSVIMLAVHYVLFYRAFADFDFYALSIKVTMLLPIAALFLNYLAMRAIAADEALVRSVDRIR